MKNKHNFTVTVVITTKNRVHELCKCLDSCEKLSGVDEILVFDDGSTDETYSVVFEKYPSVSLYRSDESLGLINARTKCATLAKGDVLISIDDDCIFDGSETVSEIMRYFNLANVAVVSIPVIDVLVSNNITQMGVGSLNNVYILPEFRGCAHAIRKDIFTNLGGYCHNLVRQEEEKEYATRLYSSNYIVRVGDCTNPILHYHSTNRNYEQIAYYRARNKIIINYIYTPFVFLLLEIVKQFLSLFLFEIGNGHVLPCISGFRNALSQIFSGNINRNPLSFRKYLFLKRLRYHGILELPN